MTEASAKILLDSISPNGDRLTTMEVVCWRPVLAEFNTHRKFSRNSASSRAIPFSKMLERVKNDLAYPLVWASEQKGMSGGAEILHPNIARLTWREASERAVAAAHGLSDLGVHKSICNRLLEPFIWHTIIVSSTEWENFFVQRCSPLAQPEIRATAEAMREALEASTPTQLDMGSWHCPLITAEDAEECRRWAWDVRHISAARCARVSYLTHDGKRDLQNDEIMFNRLVGAAPPHASPLEHVATPNDPNNWKPPVGNFDGWLQLRHMVL